MTDFEKYSLWIGFGGVLATFAAVVVAIWGERIRQTWSSPKLTITLDEPSLTTTNDGRKGWYYLLCVKNERQSSPALNVRVLLTRVFKKGPDGSWQEQRFSGPTQVTWRWADLMPLYTTVGPEERATFGFLLQGSQAFELRLYSSPNNLRGDVPKGDPTRLEFRAVSDTVRSAAITVEVEWDGKWVEGRAEMQGHLVVKQVIA
jgi:hypothetical protein